MNDFQMPAAVFSLYLIACQFTSNQQIIYTSAGEIIGSQFLHLVTVELMTLVGPFLCILPS